MYHDGPDRFVCQSRNLSNTVMIADEVNEIKVSFYCYYYIIKPVQKKMNKNTKNRSGKPKSARPSKTRNSLLFFSGGSAQANLDPAFIGIFTDDASLAACLRIRTNCVCMATSAKGMKRVNSIQMSIIFN